MKLLALSAVLFVPAVWAAAAPYQCKKVSKSTYLYAQGPGETLEFLNVSRVPAGEDTFYIQDDDHPMSGDPFFEPRDHEGFDVALCHLRSSSSDLPSTYVRLHLSRNTSLCVTIGGPGDDKDHVKPAKESFTEANTMFVKPCEHITSPMFRQQIFKDSTNSEELSFDLETIESEKKAPRSYVAFRHNKVYLMAKDPDENTAPEPFTLGVNSFR